MPGGSDSSASPGGRGDVARSYRRTGAGLFVLGVVAGAGAVAASTDTVRELLVALAGVGLFGAVLTYWIRPAATADVDPPERVYATLAATGTALARDLDLGESRVYVPVDAAADGFAPVYLAVAGPDGTVPNPRGRRPVFGRVSDDAATMVPQTSGDGRSSDAGTVDRPEPDTPGIVLYPTGAALFDAYEEVAVREPSADPVELGDQLAAGVVAGLELADSVDQTVDPDAGTATATVQGPRFGAVTRFDHPVASFLAVGFAVGLDRRVRTDVSRTGDRAYRVTCEWETETAGEGATARGETETRNET